MNTFEHLSIESTSDAFRWACILEATAPKAGNVYPGRSFPDLCYQDFIVAAEIAASELDSHERFSSWVLSCVRKTRAEIRSNANLGILLLIGPIAFAKEQSVQSQLESLTSEDAENIFDAIRLSSAGGLGKSNEMDVNSESHLELDLMTAMRSAAGRDAIAYQYGCGFSDFFENLVPLVKSTIDQTGDLLSGIADAHLRLLALRADTLIARKCGIDIASGIRIRAAGIDLQDLAARQQFDSYLRSDGNRLNPGTTADLIAAALFVMLLSDQREFQRFAC